MSNDRTSMKPKRPIKSKSVTGYAIPPMPQVFPRRLYDDDPGGYLESFRDYANNNAPAVTWFLENAETIRSLLRPE